MESVDDVLRIVFLVIFTLIAVLGPVLQRLKRGRGGEDRPAMPVPEMFEEWTEVLPAEPEPAPAPADVEAPAPIPPKPRPPPQFKLVPKAEPARPPGRPSLEDRVFRNRRLSSAARLVVAAEILLSPKCLRR